jgi:putative sterol carrier protein
MAQRHRPPEDISPHDFFTRWIPETVAADPERSAQLRDTRAALLFVLDGQEGGVFTVEIVRGQVRGAEGRAERPDLEIRVDVETWRQLNRGDLSAPEALLRRRLELSGDWILALKLHLILG